MGMGRKPKIDKAESKRAAQVAALRRELVSTRTTDVDAVLAALERHGEDVSAHKPPTTRTARSTAAKRAEKR